MATDFGDHAGLTRAITLLGERRLGEAETAGRDLLARSPGHAAAIHLLGLVRKELGDTEGGERLMRQSITLQPGNGEFRANLGNLLRRLDRPAEAEAAYREALALMPAHFGARFGLALALSDLGHHALAEAECRKLLPAHPNHAPLWSLLAVSLRDQDRLGEAESACRRALALEPGSALSHHNLGSLLAQMDRAEEAMAMLDRAAALGVGGFELAFNRGRTLSAMYRLAEAEQAFAASVAANPRHAEAQLNLARLRFMRRDPHFARDLAMAAADSGDDVQLPLLYASVLQRAGDLAEAEQVLRDLMARFGPRSGIRVTLSLVLHEADRLEEAEAEARQAVAESGDGPGIRERLVLVLLARGKADEAMPIIVTQRALHPLDQGWLAYEATAARQLGSARYRELYDYERLVQAYDIETPPGWSSVEALNAALAKALTMRHAFATHPLDQSLRNGSQTARSLLTDPDPSIQAALKAFAKPIAVYRRVIGYDPLHPLSARNRGTVAFTGAWSVQLRREGFHVNHFHPHGWISSAYYVSVPDEVADAGGRAGWIKFGEPRYPVPGAVPERFVQPRPGRLVLFPSYMWHGTEPIRGDAPRLTIAFDVAPEQTPGRYSLTEPVSPET